MSAQITKPNKIGKILLSKFRGATGSTELILDSSKSVVMVFGENGTGKSTIIDAIDFICNKSGGSVEERSSTIRSKHLPSLDCKPNDLMVEIKSNGSSWNGTLTGKDIIISGPQPRPNAHVLRRSQLLRLIEAQPAKRFDELRRFIDVDGIEACETNLNNAVRAADAAYDEETKLKAEADKVLEDLWAAEGKPVESGNDAIAWAAEKAKADTSVLKTNYTALSALILKLDNYLTEQVRLKDAEVNLDTKEKVLTEAQAALDSSDALSAKGSIEIISVLEKAQAYLTAKPDTGTCPVCEQGVDADNLRGQIAQRLIDMRELGLLRECLQQASKDVNTAKTIVQSCQGVLEVAGNQFIDAIKAIIDIQVVDNILDRQSVGKVLESIDGGTDDRMDLIDGLVLSVASLKQSIITLRDRINTDINQFNAVSINYKRVIDGKEKIKDAQAICTRLKSALAIIHAQRIKFTQNVLDNVAGEINRLYESLHPGETLGNIRLYLDEEKKGSLLQDAMFQGQTGVPPQAYFSESHLDTLGFCMFLAITKHYSNSDAIICLDDIFTSVDSVHLSRIIDLLSDESANFNQVIVTTHFRQWRDRYRLSQAPGRTVQLIELHRWSRNGGVRMYDTRLCIDELSEKLATLPFDRQAVASQAGILLEAVLDHLALIYRCPLPHSREDNYTLGELLDGIAKLSKVLIINRPVSSDRDGKTEITMQQVQIKPLLDIVSEMSFIRNQVGCHFNSVGADISDNDVLQFGKATVDFVSTIICPECGSLARRKAIDHFKCPCGKIELRPIERP